MAKSVHRVLFDLGARLGSLEGYLHSEEKVEKKYLAGWLQNIDRQFKGLPADVGTEVAGDYAVILDKLAALLRKLYGEQDVDALQIRAMAASLKGRNQ